MATTSTSSDFMAALKTREPMRPNPLMPILIIVHSSELESNTMPAPSRCGAKPRRDLPEGQAHANNVTQWKHDCRQFASSIGQRDDTAGRGLALVSAGE